MPLQLTDLSDDALVAVLLALPESRLRHWVYVALTCRALRRAAVRAFAEAQERALRAGRLPLPRDSEPPRTMATALGSVMESQWRFVLGKRTLKAPCFHQAPTRRGTTMAASLRYDPRDVRALDNREFLAAYNLSTRGIWHLVRDAPLAMIRGCFFDILCEPECQVVDLDVSLRHHRALVMFASHHARIDVLDLLLHKRPQGARAYDRERGLLRLFDERTLRVFLNSSTGGGAMRNVSCDRVSVAYNDLNVLLVRPAYISDSPSVLHWFEDAINVLGERVGIHKIHRYPATFIEEEEDGAPRPLRDDVLLGLVATLPGVGNAWEVSTLQRAALKHTILEAADAGSTRVLDCVLERGLYYYERGRHQATNRWEHMVRSGTIVFSLLAVVLGADRNGATQRWLVSTCERHALELFLMASSHDTRYQEPNATHTFRFVMSHSEFVDEDGEVHRTHSDQKIFDLEDLIWTLTSEQSWFGVTGVTYGLIMSDDPV